MTPEMKMKIADWQRKQREGTMTIEDMTDAIAYLRQGREAILANQKVVKEPKAKKVPKAKVSGADLLTAFEGELNVRPDPVLGSGSDPASANPGESVE